MVAVVVMLAITAVAAAVLIVYVLKTTKGIVQLVHALSKKYSCVATEDFGNQKSKPHACGV